MRFFINHYSFFIIHYSFITQFIMDTTIYLQFIVKLIMGGIMNPRDILKLFTEMLLYNEILDNSYC